MMQDDYQIPQSRDIEDAVLGSVMYDQDAANIVMDSLTRKDFYSVQCGAIFAAMSRLHENNAPIDQLTMVTQLHKDGNLKKAGGESAVARLIIETTSAANIAYHCEVLRDKTLKRSILARIRTASLLCYEDRTEGINILSDLEAQLTDINKDEKHDGYVPVSKEIIATMEKFGVINNSENRIIGVNTGFPSLNREIGGLQNGRLTILAGKTGEGKSALSLEFAMNAARTQVPVGLFSLEMSAEEIAGRMIQNLSPFDVTKIYQEKLKNEDWAMLNSGASKAYEMNIYISDQGGISISELMARAKRMKREKDIGLIIVDYLQLVAGRGDSQEQRITSVSRGLKTLAKNLKIPVVALSQFNRKVNESNDEPELQHLRESGAIEQDADTVLMLFNRHAGFEDGAFFDYNEGAYNEYVRELTIKKNRGGKLGKKILMLWKPEYTRFGEISYEMKGICQ